MRVAMIVGAALALSACTEEQAPAPAPAETPPVAEPTAPEPAAAVGMTPEDPGGFTEDGFTFHTMPGSKHVVRLPSPGTDTWQTASSGEPTVKQAGTRKETTAEGKAALVFEYEALQAGNVSIEFVRMEDGKVEGKRTITFMVH